MKMNKITASVLALTAMGTAPFVAAESNMWEGVTLNEMGSVQANEGIWHGIELDGYGSIVQSDLVALNGFNDLLIPAPSTSSNIKRTRVLTGFEYEEYVYKNAPSQLFETVIFADGSTKVSDRFRLAYVIKETHKYRGKGEVSEGSAMLTTELMPRYEHWVDENFSYAVEFGYEKITGLQESTRYQITPELNFSRGNHFLHLNLEAGYWHEEDAMFYETEPLYTYRYNDWITLGAKALYHEDTNDFAWTEMAIKPLVQFRFDNSVYLELRYEFGETEIFDGTGYDYHNYALYSEIPLMDSVSFLADLAYRDHAQRNGNQYTWGDKEGVFAKVGLVWYF